LPLAHLPLDLTAARRERVRRDQERTERDADVIRAECRGSLAAFVRRAWKVLEPRTKLVWNWHLEAICQHLEAVTYGRINRLCINVPPGSSKSLIVSVLWPAWEWGPAGHSDLRYLATSYSDTLVERDADKMRRLVTSEWYQALWPLRFNKLALDHFQNADLGERRGVAFGSLTSQRGDRLIIDDPHSTETAESDTQRESTSRKFREGALDRLNDLELSAIVVIMQRLHQGDVTGVIETLPELGFCMLVIPMRYEVEAAKLRGPNALGWVDPRKQEGELMDPVRFPAQEVDKLEIGKGDYAWAGQYQQRPAPREGGLFKIPEDWQQTLVVEPGDVPPGGQWWRAWDIAGSKRKTSPYTVGAKGKRVQGMLYITDVRRKRDGILAAERLMVDTTIDDGHSCKSSFPQDPGSAGLSQKAHMGQQLAGYDFRFSTESGDKYDRAVPFSAYWNAGLVRLQRGEWNAAYVDELRNFPTGSFKDQVDASSRLFSEIVREGVDDTVPAGPESPDPGAAHDPEDEEDDPWA